MGSSTETCVVCCEAITGKSENPELSQQLKSFWDSVGIDEKPKESYKACKTCSHDLEELTATQEAWNRLKKNMGLTQEELLKELAAGLEKRKKNNIPFLEVHRKIEESLNGNSD